MPERTERGNGSAGEARPRRLRGRWTDDVSKSWYQRVALACVRWLDGVGVLIGIWR